MLIFSSQGTFSERRLRSFYNNTALLASTTENISSKNKAVVAARKD
jgi:hypothetical protein